MKSTGAAAPVDLLTVHEFTSWIKNLDTKGETFVKYLIEKLLSICTCWSTKNCLSGSSSYKVCEDIRCSGSCFFHFIDGDNFVSLYFKYNS